MPKLTNAEANVQTGTLEGTVLDGLLWDGKIEFHQHAAALIYAKLRRKAMNLGFSRMRDALPADHAHHEAAVRLAGFDRFALDRLAVDGMEPVGSELERLLGVLDRLATLFRCWD